MDKKDNKVLSIDIGCYNLVLSYYNGKYIKQSGIFDDKSYLQPFFDVDEQQNIVLSRDKGQKIDYKILFFETDDIEYPSLPQFDICQFQLPLSQLFLAVFKQCKKIFSDIDDLVIIVPNSCKNWHRDYINQVSQSIFNLNPILIPACVSGSLNFVKQNQSTIEQYLQKQGSFSALYINFGGYYGDSTGFKINQNNEIQFLHKNQQSNYILGNPVLSVFDDILSRFKKPKIKKQILKQKDEIIQQIENMVNSDNLSVQDDLVIDLDDINDYINEEMLQSNFNSTDDEHFLYDENNIQLDIQYLEDKKSLIQVMAQEILKQQIQFYDQDQVQFDIIIGSGGYLDKNIGQVNKYLNENFKQTLTQMKPLSLFCAMGGSYFNLFKQMKIIDRSLDLFYINAENEITKIQLVQEGFKFSLEYNKAIKLNNQDNIQYLAFKEYNNTQSSIFFVNIENSAINNNKDIILYISMYTYMPNIQLSYKLNNSQLQYCQRVNSIQQMQEDNNNQIIINFNKEDIQLINSLQQQYQLPAFILLCLKQIGNIFYQYHCYDLSKSPQSLSYNIEIIAELLIRYDQIKCVLLNIDINKMQQILQCYKQLQFYDKSIPTKQDIYDFLFENYQQFKLDFLVDPVLKITDVTISISNIDSIIQYPLIITKQAFMLRLESDINLFANIDYDNYIYAFQLPKVYKSQFGMFVIQQLLSDNNVTQYCLDNKFLVKHFDQSSILLLNLQQQVTGVNLIQKTLYDISPLIPFLGYSCLYYHIDQDCYSEILSDGFNNFDLKSYSNHSIDQQFNQPETPGKRSLNPNIYNVSTDLLMFLAINSKKLLLNHDIRFVYTLSSNFLPQQLTPDSSNSYQTFHEDSQTNFAKMLVFSNIILPDFPRINLSEQITYLNTFTNYTEIRNEKSNSNKLFCTCSKVSKTCPSIPIILQNQTLEMRSICSSCANSDLKQEFISRPNLTIFPKEMEILKDNIRYPIISLGMILSTLSSKNWLKQVLNYNLTTSKTTPCCPTHIALAQIIPGDAFYKKCPIEGCSLHFCDFCFNWHERIDPQRRTCKAGIIQCPVCKVIGERDDKCLVTECLCKVFFCTFPDCGCWYKSYKECENHVISHKRGLGIYERHDGRDRQVNFQHQ